MSFAAFAAMSVAAGAVPAETPGSSMVDGVQLAQVTIQRSTIIRIRPAAPAAALKFKEKGAPKCLPWSNMAAAMISGPATIDLIVKGGTRYRVKLQKSCQAIDFYSGFYVKATRDGRVCEERDMIHSRSGGECGISKFKTLVPDK
jgi:hypothetical protein